jgi:hypothetical protein
MEEIKLVRCSDYSLPDDRPKHYPLFDLQTGTQITEPYLYHVALAMTALQPELVHRMVKAATDGKSLVVMYTHHLERDGYDLRAVVVATIATR